MRFSSFIPSLLLLGAGVAQAASSWSFDDASVTVQSKGAGAAGGAKDKLNPKTPLSKPVTLGPSDTVKVIMTTKEDSTAKRPHQAFLLLQDRTTGLEASFPLSVKDTGKAKVEIAQKDLPVQLFTASEPLRATLLLAGFGSSTPYGSHVFDLEVKPDANAPLPAYEKPLRYGKKEEIHHIFKPDPKSAPKIVSLVFVLAIAATVVVLFGAWGILGANVNHLSKAMSAAPVSHALFFGSIVAMEGIFVLYYSSWNLFQTLPAAGVVASVAFLSGTKALTEVQSRRLAGER